MQRLDRGFQPGPVGTAEKLADIRKMHGFRRRQTDNRCKPGRGFLATRDQIPAQKLIGRRVQEFGQFSYDFGGSGVVGFDLFHPAAIANRGADAKNGDGEPGPDPGNRIHEPFERRYGIGGGGLTGKQEQRNGTDNPAPAVPSAVHGVAAYSRSRVPFYPLISVMVRLVRAFRIESQVIGLFGCQLGEIHAEFLQMQEGDLFIQVFG